MLLASRLNNKFPDDELWLLAQPTGVAELYLAHSNKNRIYVNLSGHTSAGQISGKYEVAALLSNNTFLIRQFV